MKLALGTAQFGLDYGVSNKSGQVVNSEVREILKLASRMGVATLDTAAAYGNSEAVLGEVGVDRFDVVTKLPPMPVGVGDPAQWVEKSVEMSMRALGVNHLAGVLFHRPLQLLDERGKEAFASLVALKECGLISKVGVSVYGPSDLDAVIPSFPVDLIQAPFNVLDRRLASSGWLKRLKSDGIEVHARSIFLQGLLVMPAEKRPGYFDSWQAVFSRYDHWVTDLGITPLEACIRYVAGISEIDQAVVGVESTAQLCEVTAALRGETITAPAELEVIDEALINPAKWDL